MDGEAEELEKKEKRLYHERTIQPRVMGCAYEEKNSPYGKMGRGVLYSKRRSIIKWRSRFHLEEIVAMLYHCKVDVMRRRSRPTIRYDGTISYHHQGECFHIMMLPTSPVRLESCKIFEYFSQSTKREVPMIGPI
jgi:hypothetical protein